MTQQCPFFLRWMLCHCAHVMVKLDGINPAGLGATGSLEGTLSGVPVWISGAALGAMSGAWPLPPVLFLDPLSSHHELRSSAPAGLSTMTISCLEAQTMDCIPLK